MPQVPFSELTSLPTFKELPYEKQAEVAKKYWQRAAAEEPQEPLPEPSLKLAPDQQAAPSYHDQQYNDSLRLLDAKEKLKSASPIQARFLQQELVDSSTALAVRQSIKSGKMTEEEGVAFSQQKSAERASETEALKALSAQADLDEREAAKRQTLTGQLQSNTGTKEIAGANVGTYEKSKDYFNDIVNTSSGMSEALAASGGDIQKAINYATGKQEAASKSIERVSIKNEASGLFPAIEATKYGKATIDKLVALGETLDAAGIPDEERPTLIKDVALSNAWTAESKDRLRKLSTGELAINPGSVFGDKQGLIDEINKSDTSQASKELALEKLDRMRENMSGKLFKASVYSDTGFEKALHIDSGFEKFAGAAMKEGTSKPEILDEWSKQQKDRGWIFKFGDAIKEGTQTGAMGIGKTFVGTGAGVASLWGGGESLAARQQELQRDIEMSGQAADLRGLNEQGLGITRELTGTVAQMAPMMAGGILSFGGKGALAVAARAGATYGWAGIQGMESKLQDAVELKQQKIGRDLTPQEVTETYREPKVQIAALANGIQTAALTKILAGTGTSRVALGIRADSLTVADFLTRGGRELWKSKVFKDEIRALGRTAGKDFVGEAFEESVNQVLDKAISIGVLGETMKLGNLIEETFKAGALGGIAGGALPQFTQVTQPTHTQTTDELEATATNLAIKNATQENLPPSEDQGGTIAAPSDASVAPAAQMTRQELEAAVAEESPEDVGRPVEELAAERGIELVEQDDAENTQQGTLPFTDAQQDEQNQTIPEEAPLPTGTETPTNPVEAVRAAKAEVQGEVTATLPEDRGAPQARAVVSNFLTPESKALPPENFQQAKVASPEQVTLQNRVAKLYDELPEDDSSNPEVVQAYSNLVSEVNEQYKSITDTGLTFELVDEAPYKSSKEMIEDVKNGKLKVQRTDAATYGNNPEAFSAGKHPMLADSGQTDVNGKPLLVNDIFRGVHDYIAHSAFGNTFGPLGEEAAWKAHMATIKDPLARRALTTETRGQNSWVNYRDEYLKDGAPIKKGEPGYVSPQDRPFATQKYALLPEEALQELTNDNKQPTESPQPQVPVPAVPGAELGADTASEETAPPTPTAVDAGATTETREVKPRKKLPPKIQKPGLIGPRKSIMEEISREHDLGVIGAKPQGFTEEQLAKDALADLAEAKEFNSMSAEEQSNVKEPPRVGPELVSYLLDNLDIHADPKETMLLTYEAAKTVKEIKALRVRMAKEGSSITDDDIETKREYLRQVRDLLAYRGSRAGSALRAYRNIVNEQFEPEIMASDYYGWKNQGKPKSEWVPVSKEERTSIEKESAEIKDALAKLEKEETAHKASIAKQEQLQQENLQLKEQLAASKKPRKAPERKSTSENQAQRSQSAREKLMTFSVTFKTTGKGPSTLDRMADNARQRIKAQSSRTSAGVDPTILLDVTIIAAQYIKNGITKLVEVTAQLVKDLGEDYRKYAKPAFDKANESINSTVDENNILESLTDIAADYSLNGLSDEQIKEKLLEEFGDTFKSLLDGVIEGIKPRITKTAAGSRKKSPQELASLIDPDKELSRQMVYNMAGGLLPKFRGDALINEILRLVQPSLPHVTFHNVQDAYTGYGKAKFPNPEKLAALQRKERRLQLLNRQIGVVLQGQLPELTGRQQDRLDPNNEDDQKIRSMIEERNQLMKDLKIPEDSVKRNQMRGTLSAIKTRYRNDLAELENAIKTRTALVEKKKQAPQTDQELTELKAQKKAKRAEYNAAFGIDARQLSLEQRLKAADKALDKSLALEEKMELEGILKRPTKPGLPQTVEMKAKAAQIKAKRDARHAETRRLTQEAKELLNPPKTDTEKWNESQAKALEKTIERFEYYKKHGKYPDKTPGVAYTREQLVEDLLKTKNDLKAQVAAIQKEKRLTPRDILAARRRKKLIDKLNEIQSILDKQVESGIYITPAEKNKQNDAEIIAINKVNKSLRESILLLKKADPNWIASYEAKLNDALIKASEARTAKWEQRLRDGDFSDDTKIKREPSKELDTARFNADKAKRGWLEKRQQLNAKRAPASEKATKITQAFWELMGAFNLGYDIALGRQGLLPTLTNPKLAKVWFTVLKNSTEEGEHTQHERLSDPKRSPVAFYMQKFKVTQYKLYSPHDHLTFGKEDIPRPELLAALHNFIKNNKWLKTIPGAATTLSTPTGLLIRLERANRMAHNILSDALAAQQLGKNRLSGSKEVTKSDVILAANMAMVGVRRGSFRNEQMEKGFPLINLFFISGRYLVSGLQYATGQPVWTARGGYRGTFKMRGRVAWNLYGRVLLSTSALAYVLGKAAYGDDDEKWKRYINPLDNRFMVLEFNGVEYNFLKAITPYVSIIAKLAMGYKVKDGKIVPLRGKGAQWGRTLEDEWGVFLKNRRSLRLALVADIVKQKHYDGSEVTAWSVMKKMSTNINVSNDLKILESEQVPAVQKALSITTIHLSLDAQMKRAEKERRSSSTSVSKIKIKPLSKQ